MEHERALRTGVVLPTFLHSANEALEVATRTEERGIDGVFAYDHLWPMGRPDRPAIAPFPVLAAIAASTTRLAVGTLVARVGLVPDQVLLAELAALDVIAPGRVIAGLGTGDSRSAAENEAYGVPPAAPGHRRQALRHCARALRAAGVPVWVGSGAAETVAIAREERVAVNLWGASPEVVAQQAQRSEVTWAGATVPVTPREHARAGGAAPPGDGSAVVELVRALATAGATWAVFGWPVDLDVLARAGRDLGGGHG